MKFPERPAYHDNDWQAKWFVGRPRHEAWPTDMPDLSDAEGWLYNPAGGREEVLERVPDTEDEWRQTGERYELFPWRECGYCGSIHPEDLVAAMRHGATLHGSDWKYGWPHKFYVDVPNPNPERLFKISSTHFQGKITAVRFGTRATLSAKFYSGHLRDAGFDQEAFELVCRALHVHTGIEFYLDQEGRLMFAAPHHNYQR